jgi:hypothetical protein
VRFAKERLAKQEGDCGLDGCPKAKSPKKKVKSTLERPWRGVSVALALEFVWGRGR